MNAIVVGVDESQSAQTALQWAHAYGQIRQQPVTVLMAWDYISQRRAEGTKTFDPAYSAETAEHELAKIVERALGPDHGVQLSAVLDKPEPALLDASTSAELVVVGARGIGGFRGLLLGSVSRWILHHAKCPVVVVRGEAADLSGPIVVGVNGSDHSLRALRWASELGAQAGRRVVAVWAWQLAVVGGPLYPVVVDVEGSAREAADALHRAVTDAGLAELGEGVEVVEVPVEGQAAAQLLAVAAQHQASLVVVGARGATGLTGALLGSVSDQVVHHADVPVVVIP